MLVKEYEREDITGGRVRSENRERNKRGSYKRRTREASEVDSNWTYGPIQWVREIQIGVRSCALRKDVTLCYLVNCLT